MRGEAVKQGATRMRELGYKPTTVWLKPEERDVVKLAALRSWTPTATWMRRTLVKAAEDLVKDQPSFAMSVMHAPSTGDGTVRPETDSVHQAVPGTPARRRAKIAKKAKPTTKRKITAKGRKQPKAKARR